ncbi:MAG: hypothetical protein ACREH3_18445 [Geminicoccales bacterium]
MPITDIEWLDWRDEATPAARAILLVLTPAYGHDLSKRWPDRR